MVDFGAAKEIDEQIFDPFQLFIGVKFRSREQQNRFSTHRDFFRGKILQGLEVINAKLHHVKHFVIKQASKNEIIGSFLVGISEGKQTGIIFLPEKFQFAEIFKGSNVILLTVEFAIRLFQTV